MECYFFLSILLGMGITMIFSGVAELYFNVQKDLDDDEYYPCKPWTPKEKAIHGLSIIVFICVSSFLFVVLRILNPFNF